MVGRIGQTPCVALLTSVGGAWHDMRVSSLIFVLGLSKNVRRNTDMIRRVGDPPYKTWQTGVRLISWNAREALNRMLNVAEVHRQLLASISTFHRHHGGGSGTLD